MEGGEKMGLSSRKEAILDQRTGLFGRHDLK